ncbi:MAG: ATP-dependent DNA helicase RecQ, partial [Saprospiraceae bacterium]
MNLNNSIDDARNALQKYWKYSNFRAPQIRVLNKLFKGHDIVGLLPTGGGKSLCYQIPAIISPGLTLVISPLIALMEDQVNALKARGVAAERIHSGLKLDQIDRILDNVIYGDIKLLYVSPERLAQPLFTERIKNAKINLLAIDEAHCISQWGHDFRPSYLDIGSFRTEIGNPQTIALTATATLNVLEEIKKYISIPKAAVVRDSFKRSNISISMLNTEDKVGEIVRTVQKSNSKVIIYARSRRVVQMLATTLRSQKIKAAFYHAGVSYKEKKWRQKEFISGELQVVAATNAFGMGIDISDIGQVIHYDLPPSIEEYFQEIGRAGRDGSEAAALALISKDDLEFKSSILQTTFQPFSDLCTIYSLVHVVAGINVNEGELSMRDLDIGLLSEKSKMPYSSVKAILKAWQYLGLVEIIEEDKPRTVVKMSMSPRDTRDLEHSLGKGYKLLSALMRSHEQIFDNWVEVDTQEMAKKYKVEEAYLLKRLRYLQHMGAINLSIHKAGEKILFKKNRISHSYLKDFKIKYLLLKKRHEERWESMKSLINNEACRMNHILDYFGEETGNPCGMCDNCLKESRAEKRNQLIDK